MPLHYPDFDQHPRQHESVLRYHRRGKSLPHKGKEAEEEPRLMLPHDAVTTLYDCSALFWAS